MQTPGAEGRGGSRPHDRQHADGGVRSHDGPAGNGRTPPDPHGHTHLLVFNATHDPVGRPHQGGQFGNLKRDGEYYRGGVLCPLCADKLEALGFVIDRRGGKKWEIAGVPQSMIDKFSKRTDADRGRSGEAGHHRCRPQRRSWGRRRGRRNRRS